nr:type I secretion system permease/ATPase [Sneathiella limimaris]
MAKCRRVFIVIAIFGLCINLLMLTAPLYMMQVFDRVISSQNTDTLIMLMLIAIGALLTMAALEAVRTYVMVRLSGWLDRRLGGVALTASIYATLKQGEDANVQGLRDLATFRSFLTGAGIFPILDAPFAPLFMLLMFLLHPILGGIALAGAGMLFSLALLNEIITRRSLAQASHSSIEAMGQAEAASRNADVIEAMGMLPNLLAKWNTTNSKALEMQARASDLGGLVTSASKFLRMVLQIGVSSAGAWLVIQGEMTAGSMIAGSMIMGRALAPVEQAIGTWKGFVGARSAYARLKAKISNTELDPKTMPLPRPKGNIDVENVSYVHPGHSEPVLRNVSFKIKAGEIVGLIGPTAAGKSTLARIIVGNLSPRTGQARLDNMDVSEWPARDRGQYVGYLPQDVELFAGTIKENISRMAEGDPDSVVEAAKKAGVHEMILRMEKGYETEIGDGGMALSGGQRQRIALARAIYGNPCLLVLDEPNANLDSEGETALMEAMDALSGEGMTIIVVAHRPNVLRYADKIVVLRNGMVDDFGYRDEILEKLQGPKHLGVAGPGRFTAEEADANLELEGSEKKTSQVARLPAASAANSADAAKKAAASRMSRLQSIKQRNADRARKRASQNGAASPRNPNVQSIAQTAGKEEVTAVEISPEVKTEILSLAGRELSEAEVEEIFQLYAAGDKANMLRKLKGVGT